MFIVADLVSLTESCKGASEPTLVKSPHCWKSRVAAHFRKPKIYIYTGHWKYGRNIQTVNFVSDRTNDCMKMHVYLSHMTSETLAMDIIYLV